MPHAQTESDRVDGVVIAAARFVELHLPTPGGWCAYCQAVSGRWVWFPCEPARWAFALLDQTAASARSQDLGSKQ